MKEFNRVYATVDLGAVRHNMEQIRESLDEGTGICAVVKADAYGHGAVEVTKELESMDCATFYATANIEEADRLYEAGRRKPILIMGVTFPDQYDRVVERGYRINVYRFDMAKGLSEEAVKQQKTAYVHIGLDTGMNRLGFQITDEVIDEIEAITKLPNVVVEDIFTNFTKAGEQDKSFTYEQISRYNNIVEGLEYRGIHIPIKHCANSAATLDIKEAQLNMVRVGILMYGIYPPGEVSRDLNLIPAMELKSCVSYLRKVKANDKISYGGTYKLPSEEKIATIPVGYADGYPRSLSNKGYVLINGKKAPIRGMICMDLMMVDVTQVPDVKEFTPVTLVGKDQEEEISVEYLGELSGRFSYELLCDLISKIPRVYR